MFLRRTLALVVAFLALPGFALPGAGRGAAREPAPTPSAETRQQTRAWESREDKVLRRLKALLEPHGITVNRSALLEGHSVRTYKEFWVKWEAFPGAPPSFGAGEAHKHTPGRKMYVTKKERGEGSLPQLYDFNLSAFQLFVVVLDSQSQLRWWTVVPDPRVMWGESVGPDGKPNGGMFYMSEAELSVALPDGDDFTEVRFLQPKWADEEATLELIAALPL